MEGQISSITLSDFYINLFVLLLTACKNLGGKNSLVQRDRFLLNSLIVYIIIIIIYYILLYLMSYYYLESL